MPVSSWLRQNMRDFAHDTLLSNQAASRGYFQRERVEQLLKDHVSGRTDHGQRIWALLVLELWHQQYVDAVISVEPFKAVQV